MNFRQLIEKAMFELRDEFAELVARKLVELMGDGDAPAKVKPSKRVVSSASPKVKANASKTKPQPKTRDKRERAPESHMAALRDKVVTALRSGGALKKSDVLRSAGLSAEEGQRVAQVLRRLKEEGVVRMKGDKATATYTLL